jgi:hypothetical protein
MRIVRAVTHIRLCDANDAKVAALDALAAEYGGLCQQYVTHFCVEAEPNGYADPCFPSPLSQRWQRVAIQQAAGIARSWRANHQRAQEDFVDTLASWLEEERPPEWTPSQDTSFAYWLRVSTLGTRQPIFLPVRLAAYHERCLAGKRVDSSVTLTRKADGWWLTLTYEEEIPLQTPSDAPVVGVDAGIAHFLTTTAGKHYGSFHGRLAKRHQQDRAKRRRNPKLARTVRQEINRAGNEVYREHAGSQIAFERLNVATMRLKARRMNAYLYASNLAHIPKQLGWGAAKQGVKPTAVKSAYTSQERPRCHFVARSNHPAQQPFCCGGCGWRMHADHNAAINIAARLGDREIQATKTRQEVKAFLDARHQVWRAESGWS